MQDDLWSSTAESSAKRQRLQPLAVRMRPRTLDEVVGHEDLLTAKGFLARWVERDEGGSLLFYGPPGSGKTTLARVLAETTQSHFIAINAVLSTVADLREHLKMARYRFQRGDRTLLFIDEIHRFNRAQQDLLLPDVEEGQVVLIGATTYNPTFYINAPLLSRSHLCRLEPASEDSIIEVLQAALADETRGLGRWELTASTECFQQIAKAVDGDYRRALNLLEALSLQVDRGTQLELAHLEDYLKSRPVRYDASQDEHYDTISAYIKSMRGGDPDAALYWLNKMLEGGEDPRFVARRLFIFASEDVGLADPRALPLAHAAYHTCEVIGMPECAINLAHVTTFMATAPKSNSAYLGLLSAKKSIREQGVQSVPLHLRDSSTKLSKNLGYGKDYRYSHDFPENVSGQEFMDKPLTFYHPKESGAEKLIAERVAQRKALKAQLNSPEQS